MESRARFAFDSCEGHMENRTLSFPQDSVIGTLSVRKCGSKEEWTPFAEATGNVVVPSDREVSLAVSDKAMFDPGIFSHLEADALTELQWAYNSNVTDAAIEHILHLTGLRGLALWETNIGDRALDFIRNLSNLRWLDIGDTKVTDRGLTYLSEFSFLYYLTLLEDAITDDGLRNLQNLRSLEGLDLMDTDVTDKGAKTLSKMSQLKDLRICNTKITVNGYKKLKSALPDCRI